MIFSMKWRRKDFSSKRKSQLRRIIIKVKSNPQERISKINKDFSPTSIMFKEVIADQD